MSESGTIFVGGGGEGYALPQTLLLGYGNRHGLIAGATGTGKTVTLQVLAEGFSAAGVPVFLADVKGDLAGLSKPGSTADKRHEAFTKRAATIGRDLQYRAFPVTFWDLFGVQGHPIRTTVADMGPLLLSRLMELTEPQEGVLNIAFRLSDEEGLPLYRPDPQLKRHSIDLASCHASFSAELQRSLQRSADRSAKASSANPSSAHGSSDGLGLVMGSG